MTIGWIESQSCSDCDIYVVYETKIDHPRMNWLLLILTQPTENATARMRAWRALKASGAAVLRDGVYLLPDQDGCGGTLAAVADAVRKTGGVAHLLSSVTESEDRFAHLFDRSAEFGALLQRIAESRAGLTTETAMATLRQARKHRRTFGQLAAIDFFPGEAQTQVDAALQELQNSIDGYLSPDEPHAAAGAVARLDILDYRGRVWATRARPWVDRLASAWLIRRCIDPDARILWLASPSACPVDALGFDFDGAAFSHVGAKVTFEVLMAAFGLESPSLSRLAGIVRFLDVGGLPPVEAAGIERVLTGLREAHSDDDRLLAAASTLLDGLLAAFELDTVT